MEYTLKYVIGGSVVLIMLIVSWFTVPKGTNRKYLLLAILNTVLMAAIMSVMYGYGIDWLAFPALLLFISWFFFVAKLALSAHRASKASKGHGQSDRMR